MSDEWRPIECGACGHVEKRRSRMANKFQSIGYATRVDQALWEGESISVTEVTGLLACPKCGTVRVPLPAPPTDKLEEG